MRSHTRLIVGLAALLTSAVALARPIGDLDPISSFPFEGGPIGSYCSRVADACADVWMEVFDDCMRSKGVDPLEFDSVTPDELEECYEDADWAYEDCLIGAGC